MLSWVPAFLIFAIIAGALGFGGVFGAASSIAQILLFVFFVAMSVGLFTRPMPRA